MKECHRCQYTMCFEVDGQRKKVVYGPMSMELAEFKAETTIENCEVAKELDKTKPPSPVDWFWLGC